MSAFCDHVSMQVEFLYKGIASGCAAKRDDHAGRAFSVFLGFLYYASSLLLHADFTHRVSFFLEGLGSSTLGLVADFFGSRSMVLEALIHGSAMASCSTEMITPCRASIKTSGAPCNLYTHSPTKASCRSVANKTFHREPVHTIAPLPKQKPLINQTNVDSYQKSPFSENWIEDSICEIVKHINEAPFLQLLFDSKDNSMTITSQRQRVPAGTPKSADEKWKEMKSYVSRASPDGVILVHPLHGNPSEGYPVEDEFGRETVDRDGKDLWGILVLGKKIAKSACYILETTSVASPFGTCTSFCLTKAQSFGPPWLDQIQSSWLLKTDI